MKLDEKIKKLKKEILEISFYIITLSAVMLYHLIRNFITDSNDCDFRFWLLLGFIVWCLIIAIKGNLKAIKYYKKQKQEVSNA